MTQALAVFDEKAALQQTSDWQFLAEMVSELLSNEQNEMETLVKLSKESDHKVAAISTLMKCLNMH